MVDNNEDGMFLFSGYFKAIDAMKDETKKWEMLKAIYKYITKGIEPPKRIKTGSIFCLVQAFVDGREKKLSKESGKNEQKTKINSKTGAKNTVQGSEKNTAVGSVNLPAEKVKNSDIKNGNGNENINKNKKEIEKEIYKEKEQEKSSSSVVEDSMYFSCHEDDEELKEMTACLSAVCSPLCYDEPIDEYAKNVEKAYISMPQDKTKPTVSDVEYYAKKINSCVPYDVFYDYYDSKDWEINGEKVRDWRALFLKWDKSYRTNTQGNSPNDNNEMSGTVVYRGKVYSSEEFNKMFFDDLKNVDINKIFGDEDDET